MNKNLIEFRHISKSFPGVVALSDINIDLKPGEVHVLVGENGAGKSTLMRILSGALQADKGDVLFNGEKIRKNSSSIATQLGIGMIYQELDLIPELPIYKNIFLGNEIKHYGITDDTAMIREAEKCLQMIHMAVDPRTLVKNLGVGASQMVEIAKALSKNFKVLVLDEPTSSLADLEIKELFRIIRELKSRGVGMFYISHRLEELYEIGDRVTILRDGNVIETCGINEIDMNSMIEKIAGRKISVLYPHKRHPAGMRLLEVENCSGVKFKNINIHVDAGEIVGLAGLVGAGRTELARAIFGIDRYSGLVSLQGREMPKNNSEKIVKAGLGLLPEDRKVQGLALERSIRENILITVLSQLQPNGVVNEKNENKICKEYIKQLSIATSSVEKHVGFLSGGTQQKVVIAKWLAAKLKVFIFDEPTRGIDVGAKSEIYNFMDDLISNGAGILMISSDLPEILGMSDRIYVMSQGRLTGELDHNEADQGKVLQLAYNQTARK